MTSKKLGRLLVMLMTMLVAVVCFGNARQTTVTADAATIPGKGTPSADIVQFLGQNFTTGYTLQPQDAYTYIGNAKVLRAAVGHEQLTSYSDSFQWYQSTNAGQTWTKVSSATSATLTVNPQSSGTVYYQLADQYGLLPFLAPTYYSRVAAVTTVDSAIKATDFKATADDSYLYNNQATAATTYVHGTVTPADSTSDVSWSSSDTSLATVDKTTGQVTANTTGKSGTVTIKGIVNNNDGTTQSDSVNIKIGGGLDAQNIKSGEKATYTVQGSMDKAPTSVVWHKVTATGTDTTVSSGTSLTYTTATATAADVGSKYYAVITITTSDGTDTIKTNQAALNVTVDKTPNVNITSKITDLTDNTGNTTTAVNNVISGDNVEITGTITDSNLDSKLKGGTFLIKVPTYIQNIKLLIDGTNAPYTVTNVDGSYYLVVNNVSKPVNGSSAGYYPLDFSSSQTHTYQLDFQSIEPDNVKETTNAEVMGYDATTGGNSLDTYQGPDLTINMTDGSVIAKAAGEVTFGSLSYANIDQDIEGQVVGGGDLLDVTDNRRTKGWATIALQQETPFTNSDGRVLNATLSMALSSRKITLNSTSQTLMNSGSGIAMGSLNANSGDKLLLNIPSQAIYPGEYSSTLLWTITSAPS